VFRARNDLSFKRKSHAKTKMQRETMGKTAIPLAIWISHYIGTIYYILCFARRRPTTIIIVRRLLYSTDFTLITTSIEILHTYIQINIQLMTLLSVYMHSMPVGYTYHVCLLAIDLSK